MSEALLWSGDTEVKEVVSSFKELTAFWFFRKVTACQQLRNRAAQ